MSIGIVSINTNTTKGLFCDICKSLIEEVESSGDASDETQIADWLRTHILTKCEHLGFTAGICIDDLLQVSYYLLYISILLLSACQ